MYKSAHDWFNQHFDRRIRDAIGKYEDGVSAQVLIEEIQFLRRELGILILKLDGDDIQSIYEYEMDLEGYFDD